MGWKEPKVEHHYTVVEIEKARAVDLTSEAAASVESLRGHAGFNWLLTRLKYQGARLKAELERKDYERTLEQVYDLQNGIAWCNWLQSQCDIAHERYISMRPAKPIESDFFSAVEPIIASHKLNPNE